MSYFTGGVIPFGVREDFRVRPNTYVVSFWVTGIDNKYRFNTSFEKKENMVKFIKHLKSEAESRIISSITWKFMKGKRRK